MRPLYLFFLLLLSTRAYTQNIVVNSNFSVHFVCPDGPGQINKSIGWYRPTTGTCDYYNVCDTNSRFSMSVPNNFFGHQASSSQSYAGGYVYTALMRDYREYIATSFPPLIPGGTYKVTVVTSVAESSCFAIDGLGALFTVNVDLDSTRTPFITRAPQIDYSSFGTLSDTVNWVTLTKTFVADSAYEHLIIGNFKRDTALHFDTLANFSYYGLVYYYYDSVSVERVKEIVTATGTTERFFKVTETPNPFHNRCHITIDGGCCDPMVFTLFDPAGSIIRRQEGIATNELDIVNDGLKSGIYLYTLKTSDRVVHRGKLVVQ